MRVKWRLQGDTDGLAKVGDAEDDEYHPLPPVEVPEHLKHVAAFRTDAPRPETPPHRQKVKLVWANLRLLSVESMTLNYWRSLPKTMRLIALFYNPLKHIHLYMF